MKKIIQRTVLAALSTLMVSESFALGGAFEQSKISSQCHEVAHQLSELIERKAEDVCSGDVSVAAAYLDATGIKVWNGRYEEAKASLYYAENELQGIAYSRPYCANLAPLVKPYVAKVIRISADLDVLQKEYLKQK